MTAAGHPMLRQDAVADLLGAEGRRGEIAALRSRLGAELPTVDPVGVAFDELFLLRFVLSFKSAAEAEAPLRACVKWRLANGALLRAARANHRGDEAAVDALMPQLKHVKHFMSGKLHAKVTGLGGPFYMIRGCLGDDKALRLYMEEHGFDLLRDFMLLQRETAFHICNATTQKTGKLVKMMTFHDMGGMNFSFDRKFLKQMGAVSKLSESLFPQLLQAVVLLNAPGFVRGLMTVARPFFSRRLVEKINFCGAESTHTAPPDAIRRCPVATRLLAIDSIPSFLGGQCNCPGGCIGHPNAQRTPLLPVLDDGRRHAVLPGSSTLPLVFDLPSHTSLTVSVRVEGAAGQGSVNVSVWHVTEARGRKEREVQPTRAIIAGAAAAELKAGPFDQRGDLEVRLENAKSGKRTVSYASNMTAATAAADAPRLLPSARAPLPRRPASDVSCTDSDELNESDEYHDALSLQELPPQPAPRSRDGGGDVGAALFDLHGYETYRGRRRPHKPPRQAGARAYACCGRPPSTR